MHHVLIIEPHDELAAALHDVVASAKFQPVVRRHLALLSDLDVRPAIIVFRVGHADVSALPPDRPPIVAIASSDEEAAEAARLRCEIVLRAPDGIRQLCDALRSVAET